MKPLLYAILLLISSITFAYEIPNGKYNVTVIAVDEDNYLYPGCDDYEKGHILIKSKDYPVMMYICGQHPVNVGDNLVLTIDGELTTLEHIEEIIEL